MKEMCFEIGTIQAFLDGELASDALETVSRHISMCRDCALLLAEAEEESSIAFSALEQEFNTLVPTQRLWTKINNSIEKQKKPLRHSIYAFFKNPAMIAFASMLIVFGTFIAYLNINNNYKSVAVVPEVKQNNTFSAPIIKPQVPIESGSDSILPAKNDSAEAKISAPRRTEPIYQIVNANVGSSNRRNIGKPNLQSSSPEPIEDKQPQLQPALHNYVAGEEGYVKTIATLEKTVNNSKDAVLRPSERFAFEKDLAVVNDAITKMQAEVKKNPKNEAAKDVLRASYQNKIDLLNSVTEKSELMASLK